MKGNERKVYDLAIVGGGAAGLCAAVSAVGGNSSLAVALLEMCIRDRLMAGRASLIAKPSTLGA